MNFYVTGILLLNLVNGFTGVCVCVERILCLFLLDFYLGPLLIVSLLICFVSLFLSVCYSVLSELRLIFITLILLLQSSSLLLNTYFHFIKLKNLVFKEMQDDV